MEQPEQPERKRLVIETEEYLAQKAKDKESEGNQPVEQTKENTPETTVSKEDSKVDDYVQILSKESGLEFKTKDDIVSSLKARTALEQELSTEKAKWTDISPLALDVDKALKGGLDLDTYFEARRLDDDRIAKLSDKEAIKKWTFLSDSGTVSQDPDFAEMKFERDHKAKFGLIDAELTPEEQLEKKEEIEFTRKSLKFEGDQAKAKLKDWRKKNVTVPEPKVQQVQDDDKIVKEYNDQIEAYLGSFKSIDIPVDDKVFKYGIEDLTEVRNSIKNPVNFLKEIGVDLYGGKIDAAKLAEFAIRAHATKTVGKHLKTWALEQFNADTVKSKLKDPGQTQPLSGGDIPEKSHDEKVGEAFEAWNRKRREQQR